MAGKLLDVDELEIEVEGDPALGARPAASAPKPSPTDHAERDLTRLRPISRACAAREIEAVWEVIRIGEARRTGHVRRRTVLGIASFGAAIAMSLAACSGGAGDGRSGPSELDRITPAAVDPAAFTSATTVAPIGPPAATAAAGRRGLPRRRDRR